MDLKTPPFSYKQDGINTTSYSISGLLAGGSYKFRIKASCDKGKGVSAWAGFTTPGGEVIDTLEKRQ